MYFLTFLFGLLLYIIVVSFVLLLTCMPDVRVDGDHSDTDTGSE